MSTIKANNYEASTAGNSLIFKTNNAQRMSIDASGNLTLSSGNLTLSSGNLTLSSGSLSGTLQRGSYGSLSVSTSNGSYSGIDFSAASATFMVRTTDQLSGVYKNDNEWMWYVDQNKQHHCFATAPTSDAHLTRKDYVDDKIGGTVYTVAAGTTVTLDIKDMSIGETRIYVSTTAAVGSATTTLNVTATGSGGYVTICGFRAGIYALTGGSTTANTGTIVAPQNANLSWTSSTSAAVGSGVFSVTITRRA